MTRALILDDEPYSAKYLERLVLDNCADIDSISIVNTVDEAKSFIKKKRVDILFLDIEMPDMNGIEFLESDGLSSDTAVIVVTAYDDFALQSYQNNVIDYILKPVEVPALLKAVKKAIKLTGKSDNKTTEQNYRLSIFSNNEYHIIDLKQVYYLKAEGNYTHLLTTEKKYLISKKLGDLEAELPASLFFRVHRSYIVNLDFVKLVGKKSNHYLSLTNGEVITIAENKHSELLNLLGQ